MEHLQAHRPPLGGVVFEQCPAAGDEQGPVGGGQPAQFDGVAGRGRGDELPVAGSGVELGPIDVGNDVACAAETEQPGSLSLAFVLRERGPAARDIAERGGG